jgi:hypothetical protein
MRHQLWLLTLVLFFPGTLLAQNSKVPFENGNHAFRYVLHMLELQPRNDLSELDEDTILIVFGETQILDSDKIPGGLEQFLNNGGAVLIATDRPNPGTWQSVFDIHFFDKFVQAPSDPVSAYRSLEACPWVTPMTSRKVEGIPIPIGLSEVATNKPAYFLNRSRKLRTLAFFSDNCWIEDHGTRKTLSEKLGRQSAAFAAAGGIGQGRALVLSDHSVFINEMMIQQDNNNFDFAVQCVSWLMKRDDGSERTHVLFLDEGEAFTNFDIPLDLMDVPTPPLDIVNRFLVKLEQENFFNRLILGNNPGRVMGNILRVLTIVITTALAGFGCYRFLHARHRMETTEPLFVTKLAQQSPEVDVITQRHLTMIKTDNFWEAAHHLSRDWFETVTPGLMAKVAESEGPKSRLISFTVDAGWWRRLSWQKKVKDVWRFAVGSPRKLTAAEFARFVTQLDEVKTAQSRGLLQFRNMN